MFVAEDPLLACILRFVTDIDTSDADNQAFLRQQIKALKHHLLQFPAEQRQQKAMEWVVGNAAGYRLNWQNRTVSRESFALRCLDCPLTRRGTAEHCEIHEQWLYLLRRYMRDEIQSQEYVNQALELLRAHKNALLGRMAPTPAQESRAVPSAKQEQRKKQEKKKKRKKKKKEEKQKKEG